MRKTRTVSSINVGRADGDGSVVIDLQLSGMKRPILIKLDCYDIQELARASWKAIQAAESRVNSMTLALTGDE